MKDRPLGITISIRNFYYIHDPALGEAWGKDQDVGCDIRTRAIIMNPRDNDMETFRKLKAQMEEKLDEIRKSSSTAECAED